VKKRGDDREVGEDDDKVGEDDGKVGEDSEKEGSGIEEEGDKGLVIADLIGILNKRLQKFYRQRFFFLFW